VSVTSTASTTSETGAVLTAPVGPASASGPRLGSARLPLLYAALAVAAAGVLATRVDPLLAVALVAFPPLCVALLRVPLLGLALPLVVAPVGLTPLPVGGLQVIHLAIITAIGGTVVALLSRKVPFRPPLTLVFGAVFVAAMFAATVVGVNPLASIRVAANFLLGVCLAVCVGTVVRGNVSGLRWLLRGWALAATVLVAPALPSALRVSDRFDGSLVAGRVQGAFAQPNDFGEFALLGSVAAGALIVSSPLRRDRLLGVVGLLVGLAGVAVSFSRGAWLGGIATLLAVAVLSPRSRRAVVGLVTLIPLALVVGALLGAQPFPTLVARLDSLLIGAENPADDRPVIYAQAVHVFLTHPVLGVGPGGFLATNYDSGSLLIRRTYLHGHNVVLTVAAEDGIVGVLALLAFTVALAATVVAARRRLLALGAVTLNARLSILAAGLVGAAVHGLVDVSYTNPLLIPLLWFLAGLVAGESARVLDQRPRPDGPDVVVP
jgi:putative inorganic carbon (HCO3(-)) transporter